MKLPTGFRQLANGFCSLKLTVILLAFSLILVFFGTLDQVRIGIREAQVIYFESLLAFWSYPETWPKAEYFRWLTLPIPGGYLIGPLLTINLVAAHIKHFRLSWKVVGISLIHGGVVLLLINQLLTNLWQKDSYLWLDEGASSNFVQSRSEDELVLMEMRDGGTSGQLAIPYHALSKDDVISGGPLPLRVRVIEVFDNADIQSMTHIDQLPSFGINSGIGAQFNLGIQARERFRNDEQRDVRAAVVEILTESGSKGIWLISSVFEDRFEPQQFSFDGKEYVIAMRFKRTYMPFTLTLLDFKHEKYPGTNIPMNFSSRVHLEHPEKGVDESLTIFMNNPLRYEGLTFFQASFAKQDTASMFHVVDNPGWLIPYIACVAVSLGLFYQFSYVALKQMRRRS